MTLFKAWDHKVNILDILHRYPEGVTFEQVRDEIANIIENNPIFKSFEGRDEFRDCTAIEEFDAVLNDLYDWADENKRVWLGP